MKNQYKEKKNTANKNLNFDFKEEDYTETAVGRRLGKEIKDSVNFISIIPGGTNI